MIERVNGVMYLAEAAAHAGTQDDAQPVLAGLEQVAREAVIPDLNVHLLYARPVLADDESAEDLYLAGLEADLVRWPLVKARLQPAYGSWLRRHRRVAESRPPLRQALTAFEVIGAACWADRARAELRAAPVQQGHRGAAVPVAAHRRLAPVPHLSQARHHRALPARHAAERTGIRPGPGSAHHQDRLARRVGTRAAFVSATAVGQPELLAHHRPQAAIVHQGGQPGQFGRVGGDHEEHGVHVRGLRFVLRRRGADGDQPAAGTQQAVGGIQRGTADGAALRQDGTWRLVRLHVSAAVFDQVLLNG
jgi:hypothetical protein